MRNLSGAWALISDIPARLLWHASATDLSLPRLINTIPSPSNSPKGKSSTLFTAAKHSKGHLYPFDGDSTHDKCTDPIDSWACNGSERLHPEAATPNALTKRFRQLNVLTNACSSFRTSMSSTVTAIAPLGGNNVLS